VAPRLFAHAPEPRVHVAAVDAARRHWKDQQLLRVSTAHGQQILPLKADDTLASGQAFVAMHWGSAFVAGADSAGVNGLTSPACDATSKQPELKYAAARLEPVELPWRLLALVRSDDLAGLQAALRPLLSQADYAALVPFGRDADALALTLAAAAPLAEGLLDEVEGLLGLHAAPVLRYDDARRHARRRLRLHSDGQHVAAALVSGEAATVTQAAWLREAIDQGEALGAQALRILSTLRPPAASSARGRVVCNCFDVAETQIVERLASCAGNAEQRVATLQSQLCCGTQCGSCLPELRRMAATQPQPVAHAEAA
jgi:assimilatory nitrate reductase catalytic subunit